jgi:hypothetical protein
MSFARFIVTAFVVAVCLFPVSVAAAWLSAGMMLKAQQRDLCWIDYDCKKV